MLTTCLLIGLGFGLAFANGANDVSKGIATLVGSGVTDLRCAIGWGALWTAAGALLSSQLAQALLQVFGRGLLTPDVTPTLAAAVAPLVGATLWVAVATRTGLPVSTTHSLVGALVGVGILAYGVTAITWSALGAKVVLPLLLSPVASLGAVALLLRMGFAGSRVTRTIALDVTPMTRREGVAGNLVSSCLVSAGAAFGWPMSTTHVSSGAVAGVGAVRGSLDTRKTREIALAWLLTLPASAALGAFAFAATSWIAS